MELIVAIDQNNGIGYQDKLPWVCKEELKHFKTITDGSCLIVGANTVINLPKLSNRKIVCLVHHTFYNHLIIQKSSNELEFITKFSDYPEKLFNKNFPPGTKTFVAGGSYTYKSALETPNLIQTIHLSIMKKSYVCDKFFDRKLLANFVIIFEKEYEDFIYYKLVRTNNGEQQYLDLLGKILDQGAVSQSRNAITRSLFIEHFVFDLTKGFPLLTTKKMFLRGILEEFLFFMRGSTDSTLLVEKGVNIWNGNTTPEFIKSRGLPYAEGVMGPMYGYQWRNFGCKYQLDDQKRPIPPEGGVDQLQNVIDLIREDPNSRRIIMTSYNPLQAEEGVLYPCHSISIQFYVDKEYLDMFCFNRSQDTFLGVPYNIASSSLLLMVVAKITGKIPRFLKMTMGDTHLYENHLNQAKLQCTRLPYKFPIITLPEISSLNDMETCTAADFVLENYLSYPKIHADMVV